MRPLALQALFSIGIALCSLPARADIYKCERKDGSVLYTNTKSSARCRTMIRTPEKRRAEPAAISADHQNAKASAPSRLELDEVKGWVDEAAGLYQLPIELIHAVMRVESNLHANAVSRTGAMGLMQLMPQTARAMGVDNPFDPRQNILGGARYLRVLANQFNGDLTLTLAAYNAGEGAVEKYAGIPPYDETQRYVKRVLTHYYNALH